MTRATPRLRAATWGALAVLLGAAASASTASATDPRPGVRDLDLVASANPTTAAPTRTDDAYAYVVTRHRPVQADAAATGSATCDGCDATSTALQVLYLDHGRRARLDNTATAWTQGCADCTATVLSVQVAVLRGMRATAPNNRALALNAACASCRVAGVAYQMVVSTRARRLSPQLLAELRAWVADQAAALRAQTAAPTPRRGRESAERRARRAARAALAGLEGLVTDGLDAVPVSADVAIGH